MPGQAWLATAPTMPPNIADVEAGCENAPALPEPTVNDVAMIFNTSSAAMRDTEWSMLPAIARPKDGSPEPRMPRSGCISPSIAAIAIPGRADGERRAISP